MLQLFYFIVFTNYLPMNWAYNVTPSAFRRRGICSCGFTTLMSVAAERHNSSKSFLLSVSLVATQLCWLIVVFACILRMVSLVSVSKRMDAHESIPLIGCVVLRLSLYLFFVSIKSVVQVEPKVLAGVGHDRRSSRWHTLTYLIV